MKDGLTQVKELKDKIHEQYIEIQELNKRAEDLKAINEEHQTLNGMLRKENDRLNNIINEFMEELKWQRKVSLSLNEAFAVSRIDTLINKLQELKGSDKE